MHSAAEISRQPLRSYPAQSGVRRFTACFIETADVSFAAMDSPEKPAKKGLGALGWLGIGCGGLMFLAMIIMFIVMAKYGGKLKEFNEVAQKNPTRAQAEMMVRIGMGKFEMAKEDDVNVRYTVKDKQTGSPTTFYWDKKKEVVEHIQGDFSDIPADSGALHETPADK